MTTGKADFEAEKARQLKEARKHSGDAPVQEKALKEIVDHLVYAEDNYLLQLTPIPRNMVFDICYDITQRAVTDKTRIALGISLQDIFYEAYLRAMRGTHGGLSKGIMDMAGMQIQSQGDVDPSQEYNR